MNEEKSCRTKETVAGCISNFAAQQSIFCCTAEENLLHCGLSFAAQQI